MVDWYQEWGFQLAEGDDGMLLYGREDRKRVAWAYLILQILHTELASLSESDFHCDGDQSVKKEDCWLQATQENSAIENGWWWRHLVSERKPWESPKQLVFEQPC